MYLLSLLGEDCMAALIKIFLFQEIRDNYALLIIRVSLGLFFFSSGYHKVFSESGFNMMLETLTRAGVPSPLYMTMFVSACELLCGILLAVGLLTRLNALVLMIISTVALVTVGIVVIPQNIDAMEWFSWLMYLPETLYILMFVLLVCNGGGFYSMDRFFLSYADSQSPVTQSKEYR